MAGAGAIAQLGSTIYTQAQAKKYNDQALDELKGRREENKQWYNQKMSEDYMMRSNVQNVLRKQRELLDEQYQRARATNVVAGGTDEALALQQQAANKAMGDTMANIAANASTYKDNVEQQYRTQENAISQQQQQVYTNQANQVAQAGSQLAKTGGTMLTNSLNNIAENGIQKIKVG